MSTRKPLEFRDTPTGCRECISHARNRDGYACMWPGGRGVLVHRHEFERVNGPIPSGLIVRHTCDNPACCNPDHLLLGTQQQNVADRDARGRSLRNGIHHQAGEGNSRAKLTQQDVQAIRADHGSTHTSLARQYGVDRKTIQMIRTGKRWQVVTDETRYRDAVRAVAEERLAAAVAA